MAKGDPGLQGGKALEDRKEGLEVAQAIKQAGQSKEGFGGEIEPLSVEFNHPAWDP